MTPLFAFATAFCLYDRYWGGVGIAGAATAFGVWRWFALRGR